MGALPLAWIEREGPSVGTVGAKLTASLVS